ncbi:DUF309 domain-containing protein [Synechococcus sp. CBW1002]|uniref:DUF309 domain-containing protein n=1 Tax=Synechococcus sp. CBW1002 TaxID=1353134 RepID=UPI001E5B6EC3|nr:DUF309 domain-containing protein [Synechococcus sp. CBW1002]
MTDSAAEPNDVDPHESQLIADPRFDQAVRLFNAGEWYDCHDGFEELWHETQGPLRPVLQGILQIAVAQIHLGRGNLRGAMVLLGEGVGRLGPCGPTALGLDLERLRQPALTQLQTLQLGGEPLPLAMDQLAFVQLRPPCQKAPPGPL